MTISHRKAFELLHQGLDICLQFAPVDTQPAVLREQVLTALDPAARQRLTAHWERCPDCRGDLALSAQLRAEALARWPLSAHPRRSQASLEAVAVGQKPARRVLPVWQIALFAAALLALAWILGNLLPQPAPVPGITAPERTPPATLPAGEAATRTPDARLEALPQVVLTPIAQGRDVDHGRWSPDGRYLPFGQRVQSTEPGTDRTFTTFQVYDAQTGEICPLGGPWLGNFFPNGHAIWLADGRILLAAGREVVLARPCVAGSEPLTDQFTEPVELARPAMMTRIARAQVILTGQEAFWLYDSTTGQAQPIAGIRPNPGDSDGVYWSPSGEVIAINQVVQGGRSTLISLVAATTGQVSEVLQLPIEASGYSPWLEWLLEDVIYVFMPGGMGGLLLERQPDSGWSQTPFGMDMLGLDAAQMANHQGFATYVDRLNGVFYLAVALREPHGYLLYVYSSASEQIQTYEVPPDTLLIDPRGGSGGTLPYQPEFSDSESPTDTWYLFDLVDPDAGLKTLHVGGHRGRNYPLLNVNWLPATQWVVFASSQGISLIEASSGAPLAFWRLGGVEEQIGHVGLDLSPDQGRAVVYAVIESQQMGGHSALYVVEFP
jgi:hypothetical protein